MTDAEYFSEFTIWAIAGGQVCAHSATSCFAAQLSFVALQLVVSTDIRNMSALQARAQRVWS